MSVIVKGMEMPKSCGRCWFNDSSLSCAITGSCIDRDDEYGDRLDDCPIVALPDKHGRLVDADALEKILEKIPAADIKNMGGQAYVLVKLSQVFNVIDNQPTIEPERKKGKWIDETFKPWGLVYHPYKCDQCGEHSEADSDFCPNCGADMTEKSEEPKKCDTCKHEHEPWTAGCADCFDYELWEAKDETRRSTNRKETDSAGGGVGRTRTGSIENGQSNLRRYAGYLR